MFYIESTNVIGIDFGMRMLKVFFHYTYIIIKYVLWMSLALFLFAWGSGLYGCANQSVHDQQQAKIAADKEDARDYIVDTSMTALSSVLNAMDKQYLAQVKQNTKAPAFTIEDPHYGIVTTVYHTPTDPSLAIMMMGVSKSMIIREFRPIFETITAELQTNLKHQVTIEEVLLSVANNLPLLASIGGMMQLGESGIKAAGDTITANLSGGASLAKDGGVSSGVYNAPIDMSDNSDNSDRPIIHKTEE